MNPVRLEMMKANRGFFRFILALIIAFLLLAYFQVDARGTIEQVLAKIRALLDKW